MGVPWLSGQSAPIRPHVSLQDHPQAMATTLPTAPSHTLTGRSEYHRLPAALLSNVGGLFAQALLCPFAFISAWLDATARPSPQPCSWHRHAWTHLILPPPAGDLPFIPTLWPSPHGHASQHVRLVAALAHTTSSSAIPATSHMCAVLTALRVAFSRCLTCLLCLVLARCIVRSHL